MTHARASNGRQCAFMPHIPRPQRWQVAAMTSSAHIASVLYRTALAVLLLVQATNAGTAALRMELSRPAGGDGYVVICTPGGPKTIALSELDGDRPQRSLECECPGATLCGSAALAPPTGWGAVQNRMLRPTRIAGAVTTSIKMTGPQPMRPGSPRAPPVHSH